MRLTNRDCYLVFLKLVLKVLYEFYHQVRNFYCLPNQDKTLSHLTSQRYDRFPSQ